MKIKITKGGIYGADGEIPIGTEIELQKAPIGWDGRYVVLSKSEGADAVTNPRPARSSRKIRR